ncbi:hypothetical protein [Burkholderia multivorans]|uniref:hypothetical protein n=1 Tax=Burkholderia multivorans TaxID=87883 RepID=UPI000AC912EE|nr:hypothetical protein [Burkholderia multivorans]
MNFEKHVIPSRRKNDVPGRIVAAACALMFSVTIAAYAGLLPAGHWQDEYYTFYRFRDDGLSFLSERILTWSPRPLSELLVYIYSVAVVKTGRPLIGTVLGIIWVVTMLAVVVPPVRYAPPRHRVIATAAGLGLFALFLVNHPTGEMYYWPQASLAYMPALGAICALFWLSFATGLESRGARATASALLIVAACSIEVGALLVFSIAGLTIAAHILIPRWRDYWRQSIWLALPLIASGAVLILLTHGRVSNGNEVMGDSAIAHHAIPALRTALVEFAKAMGASGWDSRSEVGIGLTIIAKGLVFGAFFYLSSWFTNVPSPKGATRWLAILSLACLGTALSTIAAAYYQFGMMCCERHDTLRQCLIYIAIVALACAAGLHHRQKPNNASPTVPLCMLAVAVAINLWLSVPALRSDYARYDTLRDIRVVNWNHGVASSQSMEFDQIAPGQVIGGVLVKEKKYTLSDPETGWWIEGVLKFFHKTEVTFVTK